MASLRLASRVAVVTGASSGLGRAIALEMALNGARVVCADLKPRGHDADVNEKPTHELIVEAGQQSIFVATDVADASSVKTLIQATVDKFGRLDIMINNAGVAPESSDPLPIYEATEDRFDLTMKVNARGVFLGCKHAAIQMMKQDRLPGRDRGWIVNMSSGLAARGMVGVPCYSASKGAVWSMTRAVAMDLAPFHIHCNAILPGFIQTPMTAKMTNDPEGLRRLEHVQPFGRVGHPSEIAKTVVFLSSDDACGISAAGIPVDGGLLEQLKV